MLRVCSGCVRRPKYLQSDSTAIAKWRPYPSDSYFICVCLSSNYTENYCTAHGGRDMVGWLGYYWSRGKLCPPGEFCQAQTNLIRYLWSRRQLWEYIVCTRLICSYLWLKLTTIRYHQRFWETRLGRSTTGYGNSPRGGCSSSCYRNVLTTNSYTTYRRSSMSSWKT